MKFSTMIPNYLNSAPSASLRPIETAGMEGWEEDIATVSSDPGSGFSPDH